MITLGLSILWLFSFFFRILTMQTVPPVGNKPRALRSRTATATVIASGPTAQGKLGALVSI